MMMNMRKHSIINIAYQPIPTLSLFLISMDCLVMDTTKEIFMDEQRFSTETSLKTKKHIHFPAKIYVK